VWLASLAVAHAALHPAALETAPTFVSAAWGATADVCAPCPSHYGWMIGALVLGPFAGANCGFIALALLRAGGDR
jgi:hypothetical protein